ncbi:hypothetical protein BU16DRAFT_148785 [Lophium mytilinum]|uniref:Uncharacterized protein n=1 Tax=Lophium mytilinum TaxID=390894 RepID=A0A6A6QE54_9PEZI|nr:hypothetical protein BU16DRAFT_148785 [Lophium mytilinum]
MFLQQSSEKFAVRLAKRIKDAEAQKVFPPQSNEQMAKVIGLGDPEGKRQEAAVQMMREMLIYYRVGISMARSSGFYSRACCINLFDGRLHAIATLTTSSSKSWSATCSAPLTRNSALTGSETRSCSIKSRTIRNMMNGAGNGMLCSANGITCRIAI